MDSAANPSKACDQAADFIFANLGSQFKEEAGKAQDTLVPSPRLATCNDAKARVEAHMRESIRQYVSSKLHQEKHVQHELGCALSKFKKTQTKLFKQQLAILKQDQNNHYDQHAQHAQHAQQSRSINNTNEIGAFVHQVCQQFDQLLALHASKNAM